MSYHADRGTGRGQMVEQHALPAVEDKAEMADATADHGRETPLPLHPLSEKKEPIKFKDAVGRKFSFPFHRPQHGV
jgi:hypothetical protein